MLAPSTRPPALIKCNKASLPPALSPPLHSDERDGVLSGWQPEAGAGALRLVVTGVPQRGQGGGGGGLGDLGKGKGEGGKGERGIGQLALAAA